jgi:hypothetical protein
MLGTEYISFECAKKRESFHWRKPIEYTPHVLNLLVGERIWDGGIGNDGRERKIQAAEAAKSTCLFDWSPDLAQKGRVTWRSQCELVC